MTLFVTLIVLFGFSTQIKGQDPEYSYIDPRSPPFWPGLFPNACAGSRQSPINLRFSSCFSKVIADPSLTFTNYDVSPGPMTFINTGHTVQVSIDGTPTAQPSFTGGGLTDTYNFAQLHFHWGSPTNLFKGSEHTYDGRRYPLEMHLVHYKNTFADIGAAVDSGEPDAIAVIGVFIDAFAVKDNPAFVPITSALSSIPQYTNTVPIVPGVALKGLLPADSKYFYRYFGSLTTPTCNEIVVWTVLSKPVSISFNQLIQFQQLTDRNGADLVNTFRPTQSLNGRTVTCYQPISNVPLIAFVQTLLHPTDK